MKRCRVTALILVRPVETFVRPVKAFFLDVEVARKIASCNIYGNRIGQHLLSLNLNNLFFFIVSSCLMLNTNVTNHTNYFRTTFLPFTMYRPLVG